MQPASLARATSRAFVLAGASLVLWGALHPWDGLTGPESGASTQWMIAHSFHFLSGLALLGALAGLAVLRMPVATRFGTAAAGVWFVGAALWAGTGMITAWVWPMLAVHAPQITLANGPVFSPPHPLLVVTNLTFSLGMALVAVAMLRAGALPLSAAACLVLGAVVLVVPPHPIGPAPWAMFVAGAVLAGVGTAWMGRAVPRLAVTPQPGAAREPVLARV
jgi:hypothetical protein